MSYSHYSQQNYSNIRTTSDNINSNSRSVGKDDSSYMTGFIATSNTRPSQSSTPNCPECKCSYVKKVIPSFSADCPTRNCQVYNPASKTCCPTINTSAVVASPCGWFNVATVFNHCRLKNAYRPICVHNGYDQEEERDKNNRQIKIKGNRGEKNIEGNTLHGVNSINDMRTLAVCGYGMRKYFSEIMANGGRGGENEGDGSGPVQGQGTNPVHVGSTGEQVGGLVPPSQSRQQPGSRVGPRGSPAGSNLSTRGGPGSNGPGSSSGRPTTSASAPSGFGQPSSRTSGLGGPGSGSGGPSSNQDGRNGPGEQSPSRGGSGSNLGNRPSSLQRNGPNGPNSSSPSSTNAPQDSSNTPSNRDDQDLSLLQRLGLAPSEPGSTSQTPSNLSRQPSSSQTTPYSAASSLPPSSKTSQGVQTPRLSVSNLANALNDEDKEKMRNYLRAQEEGPFSDPRDEEIAKLSKRIKELEDALRNGPSGPYGQPGAGGTCFIETMVDFGPRMTPKSTETHMNYVVANCLPLPPCCSNLEEPLECDKLQDILCLVQKLEQDAAYLENFTELEKWYVVESLRYQANRNAVQDLVVNSNSGGEDYFTYSLDTVCNFDVDQNGDMKFVNGDGVLFLPTHTEATILRESRGPPPQPQPTSSYIPPPPQFEGHGQYQHHQNQHQPPPR